MNQFKHRLAKQPIQGCFFFTKVIFYDLTYLGTEPKLGARSSDLKKPPTPKQLKRARWARERDEYMQRRKGYRVILTLPSRVVFRYCGYDVQFEPFEGLVAMRGGDMPWMPPEDHAFLFSKAEECLKAAFEGVKEAQKAKAVKKAAIEEKAAIDPGPGKDPRQLRLF